MVYLEKLALVTIEKDRKGKSQFSQIKSISNSYYFL